MPAFHVAVLMATYNGVEHLEVQVASILAQTGVTLHLFARDDGSIDGTPDLLRELAGKSAGRMTVVCDPQGPTYRPERFHSCRIRGSG
jgi:glycosyltransferase involved in cell wall biosynthesis